MASQTGNQISYSRPGSANVRSPVSQKTLYITMTTQNTVKPDKNRLALLSLLEQC